MFWRIVQTYGVDPQRLLQLPIKLFWSMATYAERLRAIDQLALLDVTSIAHNANAEQHQKFREELTRRIGAVIPPPPQTKTEKSAILALIQEV